MGFEPTFEGFADPAVASPAHFPKLLVPEADVLPIELLWNRHTFHVFSIWSIPTTKGISLTITV